VHPADHETETTGAIALELQNVSITQNDRTLVDQVSFQVKEGEVLALAGLEGSGCSTLLLGLFGASAHLTGEVKINGELTRIANPQQAIKNGLALLTNDRKATGLVLGLDITQNVTLASLKKYFPNGLNKPKQEKQSAQNAKDNFSIRAE